MTRRPTILCDFTHADHVSHSHGQHVVWDEAKESHRNGRHLLTANLEAERRPYRKGRIAMRTVTIVIAYTALIGLAVYALSFAGF